MIERQRLVEVVRGVGPGERDQQCAPVLLVDALSAQIGHVDGRREGDVADVDFLVGAQPRLVRKERRAGQTVESGARLEVDFTDPDGRREPNRCVDHLVNVGIQVSIVPDNFDEGIKKSSI